MFSHDPGFQKKSTLVRTVPLRPWLPAADIVHVCFKAIMAATDKAGVDQTTDFSSDSSVFVIAMVTKTVSRSVFNSLLKPRNHHTPGHVKDDSRLLQRTTHWDFQKSLLFHIPFTCM